MTTAICTHCQVAHAVVDGKVEEHMVRCNHVPYFSRCPGSGMAVERSLDYSGKNSLYKPSDIAAKLARANALAVAAKAGWDRLTFYITMTIKDNPSGCTQASLDIAKALKSAITAYETGGEE